jgi:hypothetical protein
MAIFQLAGGELHRALEAGRPAGGQELLRVGAMARLSGDGVREVEADRSSLREAPPSRSPAVWTLAV